MEYSINSLVNPASLTADDERKDTVALANGDDIRDIEASLHQLIDEGVMFDHGQLVSVAGGGAGLNLIPLLRPETIRFFDKSQAQLTWFMVLVYLIQNSASRKTFIQRVFSRKLKTIPQDNKAATAYLSQAGDPSILKRSLAVFEDDALRNCFEAYASQLCHATVKTYESPFGTCSGLAVTKGAINRLVGLSFDLDSAVVDNFESFYLNYGWLQSERVYKATRAILSRATVSFHHARISDLPIDEWMDEVKWTYLFAGKINGAAPEEWVELLVDWQQFCKPKFPVNRLILMTSYDGISDIVNDPLGKLDLNRMSSAYRARSAENPHFRAWREIVIHLRGKAVLELSPSEEIGFHEIGRDRLHFNEYLSSKTCYDTVIVHCPIASGMKPTFIDKCLKKAWKDNSRVILFDHNPKCSEFSKEEAELPGGVSSDKWLSLKQAVKRAKDCLPKKAIIKTTTSGGYSHKNRNWFIIVDHGEIIPDVSLKKLSMQDLVYEFRHATMRRFKKELFSCLAAEKFKMKDYDSVIIAAREARLLAPDDLAITELFAWAMCYAGEPDAAGAAIVETARLHGGVSEEIQELAGKYGFVLRSERNY